VPDEVDSVGSSNDKWMQVYFEQFDALDIFIAAAKDEYKMQERDISKVSESNRNFTIPPTKKFFMSFNGTQGALYNQYAAVVKLRYYTWDAGCPEHTYWENDRCNANHTSYCASLTPDYIRRVENPKAYVYYNTTHCVLVNPKANTDGDKPSDKDEEKDKEKEKDKIDNGGKGTTVIKVVNPKDGDAVGDLDLLRKFRTFE
jgi:hypothetical protein